MDAADENQGEVLRFLPISDRKTANGIAIQLRQAIHDGVLVDGERLPAERELAESFSSSRTTIRRALRQLEHEDLIQRSVGSGTFVTFRPDTEDDDIAEVTSPLELIEVRIAVEPHMVRLATLHATLRDLELLESRLVELESDNTSAESFTRRDRNFHQAIADATHNPLMQSFYRRINHVRGHRQWNAMKDKVLTPQSIDAYNREHRCLLEALLVRDADVAVDVVIKHLQAARKQLVEA